MRGKPGWGDLFAPLTTVVQTFGGNWYDEDWNATVDTPEWKQAVSFYKTHARRPRARRTRSPTASTSA